jgi:hypothetical protein
MPSGRLPRESGPLTPQVQKALVARAGGMTWKAAAEVAGMSAKCLGEWRGHPDFQPFLDRQIQDVLGEAHSTLAKGAPLVASELLRVALDPKEKGYVKVQAAEAVFKVVQTGVVEAEQRAQLRAIREQLQALEAGGRVIDV